MQNRKFRIFVVDDQAAARLVAADAIGDEEYEIIEIANGATCLARMDEEPDVILMDIEMPGMNGVETCYELRRAGHEEAQVLFVSAHDDLDTRLAAYSAGGDDFIGKPYQAEELQQKIRLAEKNQDRRRAIADQARLAQKTAFTAMSSLGETGVVMQFLQASFSCASPRHLANAMFDALGQFGLTGMIEIRQEDTRTCLSPHGDCSPLENSILTHAGKMDRIFQFSDRMVVNFPHVTLLTVNLPMDDPERIGRLRDHLAVMTEGAETRLAALVNEQKGQRQAEAIVAALDKLGQMLATIKNQQIEFRLQSLVAGQDYLQGLQKAFAFLDLNESQETALSDIAQATNERTRQILLKEEALGKQLSQVIDNLGTLK